MITLKKPKLWMVYLLLYCVTSSSLATAGPQITRRQVVGGLAACALVFAMFRGPLAPTQSPLPSMDNQAKVVQVEKDLPKLESIRQEMDRPVTKESLSGIVKELEAEVQKGNVKAATPVVHAGKSYAGDFVSRVMENPKYQYTGLSIVAGEVIFLGLLLRRMRTNVKDWNRRAKTAGEVNDRMKGLNEGLAIAEKKLTDAMKSQSAEDRAQLLKIAEGLPEKNRRAIEAILKAEIKVEEGKAPADIEAAWNEFFGAYEAWQKGTKAEARVMSAAGPAEWKAAEGMAKLIAEEETMTKLIQGLDFSWSQTQTFKNQLQHVNDQAKKETGQDLNVRQRVFRYLRNALFLLLVPVIPLAIIQTNDRGEENQRRIEDLNVAALEDRQAASQTLVPSLFRPLLWTVTEVWRNEPRLANFKCPLAVKPVEEDNPDISVMQAILYQSILESNQTVDVTKPLEFRYDEKFFERVLRKVLALNPTANGMDAKAKDAIIADMAYKARRIFDEPAAAGFKD